MSAIPKTIRRLLGICTGFPLRRHQWTAWWKATLDKYPNLECRRCLDCGKHDFR